MWVFGFVEEKGALLYRVSLNLMEHKGGRSPYWEGSDWRTELEALFCNLDYSRSQGSSSWVTSDRSCRVHLSRTVPYCQTLSFSPGFTLPLPRGF